MWIPEKGSGGPEQDPCSWTIESGRVESFLAEARGCPEEKTECCHRDAGTEGGSIANGEMKVGPSLAVGEWNCRQGDQEATGSQGSEQGSEWTEGTPRSFHSESIVVRRGVVKRKRFRPSGSEPLIVT